MQEQYCTQDVLRAEDGVLRSIEDADPADPAAAMHLLARLKQELKAANEVGLPNWLADVHARTTLESHLSKGWHSDVFDCFLEMNSYRSIDWEEDHLRQLLTEADDAIGLAALTLLPSSPMPLLEQGNPGYTALACLDPDLVPDLVKQVHVKEDGYLDGQPINFLVRKHFFDGLVRPSASTEATRAGL